MSHFPATSKTMPVKAVMSGYDLSHVPCKFLKFGQCSAAPCPFSHVQPERQQDRINKQKAAALERCQDDCRIAMSDLSKSERSERGRTHARNNSREGVCHPQQPMNGDVSAISGSAAPAPLHPGSTSSRNISQLLDQGSLWNAVDSGSPVEGSDLRSLLDIQDIGVGYITQWDPLSLRTRLARLVRSTMPRLPRDGGSLDHVIDDLPSNYPIDESKSICTSTTRKLEDVLERKGGKEENESPREFFLRYHARELDSVWFVGRPNIPTRRPILKAPLMGVQAGSGSPNSVSEVPDALLIGHSNGKSQDEDPNDSPDRPLQETEEAWRVNAAEVGAQVEPGDTQLKMGVVADPALLGHEHINTTRNDLQVADAGVDVGYGREYGTSGLIDTLDGDLQMLLSGGGKAVVEAYRDALQRKETELQELRAQLANYREHSIGVL